MSEETAAVIVEPIQSMGGVYAIPTEILRQIRESCDAQGALLIFDEVQTGVGRTGSFLYSGHGEVYADMVTLAQGARIGTSCECTLLPKSSHRRSRAGDLGATFGGGPVCLCSHRSDDGRLGE